LVVLNRQKLPARTLRKCYANITLTTLPYHP
jgi:hypothetical protein